VSPNLAFCLFAGAMSLLVVVLAGLKGDWIVVIVYAMLAVGFAARARLGRGREPPVASNDVVGPRRDPRLRSKRFKRR
jgi:hypothetical protein